MSVRRKIAYLLSHRHFWISIPLSIFLIVLVFYSMKISENFEVDSEHLKVPKVSELHEDHPKQMPLPVVDEVIIVAPPSTKVNVTNVVVEKLPASAAPQGAPSKDDNPVPVVVKKLVELKKLPSKVIDAKSMPIFRYSLALPIQKQELEFFHNHPQLVLDKELKVNKTKAEMQQIEFNYDENSAMCHCGRISEACSCCLQANIEEASFRHRVCVNFTYLPKFQALKLLMMMDDKQILGVGSPKTGLLNGTQLPLDTKDSSGQSVLTDPEVLLLASNPPVTCVGENLCVCVMFHRVEYQVRPADTHKTRLRGCLDISIKFHNQDIAFYQAGCFTAQTNENELDAMQPFIHMPA